MKIYFEGDSYKASYLGYVLDTGTRSFIDAVAIAAKQFEPQLS